MAARPYCVAVTGGVASGKSAVTDRFAAHGVEVVDADLIAREVVAPGSEGLREVADRFGEDVLAEDGSLDRRAMRRRVFADPDARRALEAIIHPRVRERILERVAAASGPYVLVSVPLLAENWQHYRWVDRVLVVDVDRDTQLARLTRRDGVDRAAAEQMIAVQASRDERLAIADDAIVNEGSLEDLDRAVATLDRRYRMLAR